MLQNVRLTTFTRYWNKEKPAGVVSKNIPPFSTKIRVNEELPHKATLQYNIQIFQIGY